jgi:flagellar hook assembly protein FlgD
MVQMPVGIEQAEAHAVPLAVSFSNPSGPSVFFNTQVPVPGNATLRIFNCSGRLLRTLQMDSIPAGVSRLYWDGRDSGGRSVSSGVYFIELSQSRKTIIKKLVLVR